MGGEGGAQGDLDDGLGDGDDHGKSPEAIEGMDGHVGDEGGAQGDLDDRHGSGVDHGQAPCALVWSKGQLMYEGAAISMKGQKLRGFKISEF